MSNCGTDPFAEGANAENPARRYTELVMDEELISDIVSRLKATVNPRTIFLFGSTARGDQRGDSDIDLLLVLDDDVRTLRATTTSAYRSLRGLTVPVELKLVHQGQFARRSRGINTVERTVLEEGRRLYERG